ncbi:hypothetical protein NKH63_25195 [Mesorhizobium sp. M0960]|uniref:hypothetical protein n=1 Tax=Mesorhizobium sp. M0960 TaxID=2957035 RepID=UPI00333D4B0A
MLMHLSSWRTSTLALARTILPVASAKRRAGDLNIPLCGDIFGIPRNERRELDMKCCSTQRSRQVGHRASVQVLSSRLELLYDNELSLIILPIDCRK